ncbi:MAG TPA: pyruvate formate-lyase-activating protein [Candidatus Solibacter sp.]|nr:pyruvate formate-lyase-activating protein [Candidatus Solibacter sp.]
MTEELVQLHADSPYELRVNHAEDVPERDLQAALASGEIGFLHSFTTGSAVDGPGIRIVAWTAGCLWRCMYCHNPDTWTMRNGIPVTVAKAAEELRKYRNGLRAMRGGLTLSGGEPLLQDRFAIRLFSEARTMGIHTALDTNGYLGDRLTDAELEKVDLVMLDIKGWDPERHRRLTGMGIGPVLAFAQRLSSRHRPIWLRFVLVPGLTDNFEDIRCIANFVAGLGVVERVDVLPFHQMGRYKWKQLGLKYELDDTEPPSIELVDRVAWQFRNVGLNAF